MTSRARTWCAVVVVLLVGPGWIAATATAPAASGSASSTASSSFSSSAARDGGRAGDRPWAGFKLKNGRQAAAGFVGARRLRSKGVTVYRVDPGATKVSRRYGKARTVAKFGKRSRTKTACAAVLLSKYGARKNADRQSAGVDVAVLHLLRGGKWTVNGKATRHRLRGRQNSSLIRAYGQQLVRDYCHLRGPYRVQLTANTGRTSPGSPVTYTTRVRSAQGTPMQNITVTATSSTGERRTVTTGGQGAAQVTVRPRRSGPFTVTARVSKLPTTALRVRDPKTKGASRLVEAGRKLTNALPRREVTTVVGQPTVAVKLPKVKRATPFQPVLRLSGSYGDRRKAVFSVYGPFPAKKASGCKDRERTLTRQRKVAGGGKYRLKTVSLDQSGWYAVRAKVSSSTYNKTANKCWGSRFRVR